jgi:hypothetical protein
VEKCHAQMPERQNGKMTPDSQSWLLFGIDLHSKNAEMLPKITQKCDRCCLFPTVWIL